ncbi:MAG: hypothetical protein KIS92_24725, partial [Planctomycetota bacterium]|nr:hypothetical protein [Planctomycetota bacterium]
MALLRTWMRSHPRALGLALGLGVAAGLALGAALLGEWYQRRQPPPGEQLDVTVEAVAPAP